MAAKQLPSFTAEASLAKTSGHYRTGNRAINLLAHERRALRLAAIDVPGEVIEIEDDAPWTPPSWGGHTGPGTSEGSSDDGGGGPGGGGDTEPSDKPPVDPNKPSPGMHGCSMNQTMSEKAKPCVEQTEHDLMSGTKPVHYLRCTGERKGEVIHPDMACCRGRGKRAVCKAL